MKVFISYSRVDTQFTYQYVARVRRTFPGSSFWFDEELHGGDNWWNAILDQITSCDIFIYLLSNESLLSPYCRAELAEAQRLQKRIITVMVRARTQIPAELSDIQYVDMTKGVDDPDALTNMSRAINYQRDNLPLELLPPLWQPRTERPSSATAPPQQAIPDGQPRQSLPSSPNVSPTTDVPKGYQQRKYVSIAAVIALGVILLLIALLQKENLGTLQNAAALEVTHTPTVTASLTKTTTATMTRTSTATPTRTPSPTVTPTNTATLTLTPTFTPSPSPTFIPLKNLTSFTTYVIGPSNAAKIQPLGQFEIGKITNFGALAIDWSPDGKLLAVAGTGRGIKVFSVTDFSKPLYEFSKYGDDTSVDFSPDQQYLASSGWDGAIYIWSMKTGKLIRTIYDGSAYIMYSPDGRYLLGSAPDFKLRIWQASTGRVARTIDAHTTHISGIAYSPDGRYFVSSSMDRTVKVWDANSGENIYTLNGDAYCAMGVAYSPDKGTILNGGCGNLVKLWNAASGKLINLKVTTNTVNTVAYNPASTLLVAGDADRKITIWNATSGNEVIKLNGHLDGISNLAFSPDGRFLASSSVDGVVILWGVPSS